MFQDNRDELGVKSYGITATSLEEVFIKVAELADEEEEKKIKEGMIKKDEDARERAASRASLGNHKDLEGNAPILLSTVEDDSVAASGSTPSTKLSSESIRSFFFVHLI